MTDIVDSQKRSEMMSRIRGRDTKPELIVRRIAHRLGFRFRLHRKDLPGCPDIVFPRYRAVIMVHGCFWHRHPECRYAYTPKTRVRFWQDKFENNVVRDRRNEVALRELGWRVLVIWECEVNDLGAVEERIEAHLKVPDGRLVETGTRQRP
ncbi:MAG: DNA mismatch endonuclease Vsr [Gemmatimonadetes bacterium]|nr:DNA mismatch endonuclease Vsr [Gemmatimonadota bacterium]